MRAASGAPFSVPVVQTYRTINVAYDLCRIILESYALCRIVRESYGENKEWQKGYEFHGYEKILENEPKVVTRKTSSWNSYLRSRGTKYDYGFCENQCRLPLKESVQTHFLGTSTNHTIPLNGLKGIV